jgi:hypothetical protein
MGNPAPNILNHAITTGSLATIWRPSYRTLDLDGGRRDRRPGWPRPGRRPTGNTPFEPRLHPYRHRRLASKEDQIDLPPVDLSRSQHLGGRLAVSLPYKPGRIPGLPPHSPSPERASGHLALSPHRDGCHSTAPFSCWLGASTAYSSQG